MSSVDYALCWQIAERLHRSGVFSKFKSPEAAFAAIGFGVELGLTPIAAASSVHVVEGTPALSARALQALILSRGYGLAWIERSDVAAELEVSHPARGAHRVRYTLDDARRAGLASRKMWQAMPRAMMTARCLSEAVSSWCADVLGGAVLYTEEEARDIAADRATPRALPEPSPVPAEARPALPPPPAVEPPTLDERRHKAIAYLERRGMMEAAVDLWGYPDRWMGTDLDEVATWIRQGGTPAAVGETSEEVTT